MTESQILTLNERVKAFSNFFFNLAAGLTAAVAARLWVKEGLDLTAGMWLGASSLHCRWDRVCSICSSRTWRI
jgi:hypothetical protein